MNELKVDVLAHAWEAHRHLEVAIIGTPTGPTRNDLTQANIFLLAALAKLREDTGRCEVCGVTLPSEHVHDVHSRRRAK